MPFNISDKCKTHAIVAAPRIPIFKVLVVLGTSGGDAACRLREMKSIKEAIWS